jgi:hypothetical protein
LLLPPSPQKIFLFVTFPIKRRNRFWHFPSNGTINSVLYTRPFKKAAINSLHDIPQPPKKEMLLLIAHEPEHEDEPAREDEPA